MPPLKPHWLMRFIPRSWRGRFLVVICDYASAYAASAGKTGTPEFKRSCAAYSQVAKLLGI